MHNRVVVTIDVVRVVSWDHRKLGQQAPVRLGGAGPERRGRLGRATLRSPVACPA